MSYDKLIYEAYGYSVDEAKKESGYVTPFVLSQYKFEYKGKMRTIADVAAETGLPADKLHMLTKEGMSLGDAVKMVNAEMSADIRQKAAMIRGGERKGPPSPRMAHAPTIDEPEETPLGPLEPSYAAELAALDPDYRKQLTKTKRQIGLSKARRHLSKVRELRRAKKEREKESTVSVPVPEAPKTKEPYRVFVGITDEQPQGFKNFQDALNKAEEASEGTSTWVHVINQDGFRVAKFRSGVRYRVPRPKPGARALDL